MIADAEINGVFLADQLRDRFPCLFQQLNQTLVSHGVEVRLLHDVRDIWARDYCPIQVGSEEFVQFQYEPDYLKRHPKKRTGREVSRQFQDLGQCLHSEINLDGGNVVASQKSAILTDKIYAENRNRGPDELREELQELLQVEQLIVIPKEPDETFGHSDGMLRFINERSVLINDYTRLAPAFGNGLATVLHDHDLIVESLPYTWDKRSHYGIESAVGCYTNFLRTEQVIVVPAYGRKHDEEAIAKLRTVFPNVPVVSLDCRALASRGGVLNCIAASFRRGRRNDSD
jgi:agmatine deiminase